MAQITESLKEYNFTIKTFLEHSKNINERNYEGETLFQTVIKEWIYSREEKKDYYLIIAQALLAKGADLNEPDKFGKRPLIYAIEKRNLHVIEFLEENGADFSITTEDGKPLIHLVFTNICMNTGNNIDMTVFNLLLKHAKNINHKNSEGNTMFHELIWKWACSPDVENDYYMKIARVLINKGADINEPNEYGTRPLCYAVERHNLCIVEFLGEQGADFDVTSGLRETLMHLFFKGDDVVSPGDFEAKMKLFDLLLEKSTVVDHKNSEGDTPFCMIIRKWATSEESHAVNYMRMAQALMAGIDIDTNEPDNYYGKTLRFSDIEKHNLGIVGFLEENGAYFSMRTAGGETLIHRLVKDNNCWKTSDDQAEMNLLKLLISKGCQVNARDKAGTTPLHVAAMHSNVHVVRMLIEHGARVNCRNNEMETPLHFAMRNPKVEVVAGLLLRLGANVNAKDSKGQTALHKIAIESRSEHSLSGLELLLAYGADVNALDSKNRSALICARIRDHNDWQQKRQVWVDEQNELLCQRAAQNGDGDDPVILMTINECPIQDRASDVVMRLVEQFFKLKLANFPLAMQIKSWLLFFLKANKNKLIGHYLYILQSKKEIEALKSTFLDNRMSLYDFLHMDLNRKRSYVNNEKLKKLIRTPLKLKKCMFPVYGDFILANYREAAIRKVLLEPAREAWINLTEIRLPAVCLDIILSFLDNGELFVMLGN